MKDKNTKTKDDSDADGSPKLHCLVLFLCDCAWFAKRWRPLKVSFCNKHHTRLLWAMARRRRKIKALMNARLKEQNAKG